MYDTKLFNYWDIDTHHIVLRATIRALEMARFRTMASNDELSTKEHDWLLDMERKLSEFFLSEPPPLLAQQECFRYVSVLRGQQPYFRFYDHVVPVAMMDALRQYSFCHDRDITQLCTAAICNSSTPLKAYTMFEEGVYLGS
jgi:hypothetical protein